MSYRVGDLLTCTYNNGLAAEELTVGKDYEIIEINEFDAKYGHVTVMGNKGPFSAKSHRFVKSKNVNERYLQELIKDANAGRMALLELYKLAPKRLQYEYDNRGEFHSYQKPPKPLTYILKSNFKNFKFRGWEVSMPEHGVLKIGCKKFSFPTLQIVLRQVLDGSSSVFQVRIYEEKEQYFEAKITRKGLLPLTGYDDFISWEEVEELYNKIKDF